MITRATKWLRLPPTRGSVLSVLIITIMSISSGLWAYQHNRDVADWHACVARADRAQDVKDVLEGLLHVAVGDAPHPSATIDRMTDYLEFKLPPLDCGKEPGWLGS